MSTTLFPLVDAELSKRLEGAEASANACFVESRARQMPEVGACWQAVGGTRAMFDGVGSPVTQTFGLGMFEPATNEVLETLERCFIERGSDVYHEVSPLADGQVLTLLHERGYRPCELTNVLYQPLPASLPQLRSNAEVQVALATVDEHAVWAETAMRGWSELTQFADFMLAFGRVTAAAAGSHPFLARLNGKPIATGALLAHDGVAVLAGASTIPDARKRGAQRALLRARLEYAAQQGCTLAMMCAQPGSASQRNAERSGFRIAYTRIKWHKPLPK